nr:DUF2867 domain-containing protein [uncultured Carboxylicivirga sp.]
MKKVREEQTVLTQDLNELLPKIDFCDTFATTNHENSMQQIAHLVFNTTPGWVKILFSIRNKIVGVFGLKTKMPDDYNEEYKVGGYVKFFKIYSISDNEVVLGANDSHLNFRAVITNNHSNEFNIKVTTLVEFNNTTGKIYMGVIKPFHRQVVKRMVKNAFKEAL